MSNYDKGLPIGDVDYLRILVQAYKRHRDDAHLELFFSMALVPFYDAMWDGLKTNAGHVIYRLSDFVPEDKRRRISIYPSDKGSIIIDDYPWDSLEDWRSQWEKYHPHIPEFMKMLPSASDILSSNEEL